MVFDIRKLKYKILEFLPFLARKRFYCHYPYSSVFILLDGSVSPCCFADPIGNLNDDELVSIWNSDKASEMRYQLSQGDLEKAGCSRCGFMKRRDIETYPRSTDLGQSRKILDNIRIQKEEYGKGKIKLTSLPSHVVLQVTEACNLRCIMCFQDRSSGVRKLSESLWQKALGFHDLLDEIQFTGGEPFLSKRVADFLENFDVSAGQKFSCTTNGSLLRGFRTQLEKLPRLHLGISVDAATKETYESIRVNSSWDEVSDNIAWFASERRKRRPLWDTGRIAYVIMKKNYEEIPQFVEWARDLEMPVMFAPVFGEFIPEENIFDNRTLIDGLTHPGEIMDKVERITSDMPSYERDEIVLSLRESLRKLG